MKKLKFLLPLAICMVSYADPISSLNTMGAHLKEYHAINSVLRDNLGKKINVTMLTSLRLYEMLYRIKQRNRLIVNFHNVDSVNKD